MNNWLFCLILKLGTDTPLQGSGFSHRLPVWKMYWKSTNMVLHQNIKQVHFVTELILRRLRRGEHKDDHEVDQTGCF